MQKTKNIRIDYTVKSVVDLDDLKGDTYENFRLRPCRCLTEGGVGGRSGRIAEELERSTGAVRFVFMGESFSHWSLYFGWGLWMGVSLLTLAKGIESAGGSAEVLSMTNVSMALQG